jgi:hypothetical protein
MSFMNSPPVKKAQLIKAWVLFNGTGAVSIYDSFNVDSITDDGTGKYSLNLTDSLDDVNAGGAGSCGGSNNSINVTIIDVDTVRVLNRDASVPANEDHDNTSVLVIGN